MAILISISDLICDLICYSHNWHNAPCERCQSTQFHLIIMQTRIGDQGLLYIKTCLNCGLRIRYH